MTSVEAGQIKELIIIQFDIEEQIMKILFDTNKDQVEEIINPKNILSNSKH